MKIAFIGQKGMPATFGGIEQHVEELAARLTERGHVVSVYVRDWYTPREQIAYRGAKLIHTPTIKTKHLDAFVHSLTSSMCSLLGQYDIIHYHAIGPSFFSWIPRMARKKTVATIHRLDYDADKWGRSARCFLRMCEQVALKVPHRTIVVGKHQYKSYLEQGYSTICIPNGVTLPKLAGPEEIKVKYGLEGLDYVLFLGRLVPEKRVDLLINAFLNADLKDLKLVIAGGSSATDEYVRELHRRATGNSSVVFTDYVTGRLKAELFSNARFFVIPSSLEGLPIALLEAMSYGLPCLASDIAPHLEVITNKQNGYLFNKNDLADLTSAIKKLASLDLHELSSVGETAKRLVERGFDWDDIVVQIEEVYRAVLHGEPLNHIQTLKVRS